VAGAQQKLIERILAIVTGDLCWISRELSRLISPKLSHPISPN
jgi:hypothetical protein